ncbi:P-loop NTPase fold protein [uncultured Tenacibaculum sp.]|uniref:KAP family P-loop NTPase fold protein n=1 Tax=uncultured Tenacibaculum sp. TaxID=174713 RepID=UPI0026169596|nr:P-loop NTPase fold protein [uncultured Tenacibaculum sp.]
MSFISSSPISKSEEDIFNFKHYAKKIQKIIQNSSDNPEPLTIGVFGKWGEGKTSFLNLVEKQIDVWKKEKEQNGILKYHFNPWRYSTEEEMLFDFFDGLSKMMFVEKNSVLQKVGKQLVKYSRYTKAVKLSASVGLSPSNKVGATFDVSEIMKALGEDFVGKEITLEVLIDKINEALKKSNYNIIVFIDDIDRLDKNEIYTILKLIKLNANFNNFVYIVALDKDHVAKAISKRYGDSIGDGEAFLEKIINIPIHLPKIEKEDFKFFFDAKLKEVIDNLSFSNRKEEINEIRDEFRFHYFKRGREVIRVFNSFFVSAFAIGEEVNLRDLFWIEYLKVNYNVIFNYIKNYDFSNLEKKLITINDLFGEPDGIGNKYKILKGSSRDIVNLLYPHYHRITKERLRNDQVYIKSIDEKLRINSPNHFEKYFSYHTVGKVSEFKKKLVYKNITDEKALKLKENLLSIKTDVSNKVHRFYDVLESLIKEEGLSNEFFYNFLFSNLDILPESEKDVFGLTYQSRIVELIAIEIDKSKNQNDTLNLASKLEIEDLCHFTRKFKEHKDIRNKLNELISKKAKKKYLKSLAPFFHNTLNVFNKAVMKYWKEYDEESFNQYIDDKTNNFESIVKLVRNFPDFYSSHNSFNNLNKGNYDYMKTLIKVDAIYKKIEQFKPDLIKLIDSTYTLSSKDESSELENLEQFIFFYKIDKKLLN